MADCYHNIKLLPNKNIKNDKLKLTHLDRTNRCHETWSNYIFQIDDHHDIIYFDCLLSTIICTNKKVQETKICTTLVF